MSETTDLEIPPPAIAAHRPSCTAPIEGHEGACVVPGANEMPCDHCQGTGVQVFGGADAETDPPMEYPCSRCKGSRLQPRPPVQIPPMRSISDILAHVRPAADAGRRMMFDDGSPLERVPAWGAASVEEPSDSDTPDRYVERPYVPAKHRAATFETFDPTIAGTEHLRDLAAAKRAVERWTKAAIDGRPAMLAIVGSTGNGKSHLAYAAARALEAARVEQWCYPWYKLADALRYGGYLPWSVQAMAERGPLNMTRLEGWQLRERMQRSRIVIVDEVTGTAGTDFDGQELKKLACHAYDEGTALLITSNVYPLAEIMGPAAADRFAVVQIKAPSRRADP